MTEDNITLINLENDNVCKINLDDCNQQGCNLVCETKDIPPIETIDENNLSKFIVDFSYSQETRLKAIEMYFEKEGRDNTIETVNKLRTLYELSGLKILKRYLLGICENTTIDPILQSLAAQGLWSYDKTDEASYKAIDIVFPKLTDEAGTPFKIQMVKMLMNNENYKEKARDYFISIINNNNFNVDYRYKEILSLENLESLDKLERDEKEVDENVDYLEKKEIKPIDKLYYIKASLIAFVKNIKNSTRYRILSSQYLLQKIKLDDDEKENIQNILLSFANDEKTEYNERADATDVLLQLGSENIKLVARDIIMKLGSVDRKVVSVYDNAQNVHTREIEDSVKDALEFLQKFDLLKVKGKAITFDYVEKKILEMVGKTELEDKIKLSLNRIAIDRALYSKYNCTLSHILLQIWTYLTGHKNEDSIKARLMEELCDMAGTCSSGFATRLINTISGFGDFSVRISWRDQIIANLTGRLNAKIRNMDNLRLQEKVLEEMTIKSGEYDKRKNFLKFFRRNILDIREEMYQEFNKHLSDVDYDLYFRSAISMYENGEC